jgi:hypothetical protein
MSVGLSWSVSLMKILGAATLDLLLGQLFNLRYCNFLLRTITALVITREREL